MARRKVAETMFEQVLLGLAAGRWEPGTKLPPVRRLAREFGVSHAAVISAVQRLAELELLDVCQRQPVYVRPGAPEKARGLLGELPLHPGGPNIAILVRDLFLRPGHRHGVFAVLHQEIIQEAARHNMKATVIPVSPTEQRTVARTLAKEGYDAAILTSPDPDYLVSLFVLQEQSFPTLVFNYHASGLDLPTVFIDDYTASQRVAAHLMSLGHRNLCMVTQETQRLEGVRHNLRVPGWLDYLVEHELLGGCTMPIYTPIWTSHLGTWRSVFTNLVISPDRPTAIVFAHDPWARHFLEEPTFAELRVPDELSLITFQSDRVLPPVPWCPRMSTVDIDYHRAAECMIEMVAAMLGGNPHPSNIRVPLQIEMTDSVGPAPAR